MLCVLSEDRNLLEGHLSFWVQDFTLTITESFCKIAHEQWKMLRIVNRRWAMAFFGSPCVLILIVKINVNVIYMSVYLSMSPQ